MDTDKIMIRPVPSSSIIVLLSSTVLWCAGAYLQSRLLLMLGLFCLFFCMTLILKKESYLCVAFMISFFTFLMGRILINSIAGEDSLLTGAFIFDEGPEDSELMTMMTMMFVSIAVFSLSALSVSKKDEALPCYEETEKNLSLENACLALFYLTVIFKFAVAGEKVLFIRTGGSYTAYYTSFARILPSFVYKIAELNTPAFYSVLAFSPPKRKTMPVILLYWAYCFLDLLAGQRNKIVRAVLLCACYILLRNKWDKEDRWVTGTQIKIALCAVPLAVIALQAWGSLRNGISLNSSGAFSIISDFFRDQGSTGVVLYEGVELSDSFPKGVNYTFAPIVNFFLNNKITRLFYHAPVYAQQTEELALYGNSFGATLTYLFIPYHYSIGIGVGTSYISEVFHDFGWVGLAVINAVYGILLIRLERYFSNPIKSPWVGMILLAFTDGIIYAPRDSALSFIMNGLSFTVVLYIALAYALASLISKGRIRQKNEKITDSHGRMALRKRRNLF